MLRLPREVHEDEEVQGAMEISWGEEHEGKRTGIQIGWDTVRVLQEEDEGMAASFRMTNTGGPAEEVPLPPVGHTYVVSARRISLTVHGLPADMVWYLVLVQAYLEQGRAKGDGAWCHRVVVTNGRKARTENKWAVYRGVKESSVDEGMRTYDIGRHTVYCHDPRGMVHIPEPTRVERWCFQTGQVWTGSRPRRGRRRYRSRR